PVFEGPLDLLLHLIAKHELNILDLPVAFVTEKYLGYLELMKELNLDVASEYLVMAAKLIHIKSKMLLPAPPSDQEEEAEEEQIDPREDLIRRLLEYQKYKRAADQLGSREIAGRDVFTRTAEVEEAEGPAPLAPIDLFKLLDAFQGVMKRLSGAHAFNIDAERISIQERITQIVDTLSEKKNCTFDDLFAAARHKYDVVVTFLAILEMTKMRLLRIYQPDSLGTLHLEHRLLDPTVATYPPPTGAEAAPTSDVSVPQAADVPVEAMRENALEPAEFAPPADADNDGAVADELESPDAAVSEGQDDEGFDGLRTEETGESYS
ncbi:MAG: segregation/condensation protein A, partial [Myxococcales bacterium]|nr:segregation/condensation protein A [Myxococcales bacterium]